MKIRRNVSYKKNKRSTAALILTAGTLLLIGIMLVYNSTVFYSQNVYGNPYQIALLHSGWVILGIIGFVIFYSIHYKRWIKLSTFIFGFSLLFLILLAVFGFLTFQVGLINCVMDRSFVPCINGAYRWFYLNPKPLPSIPMLGAASFQPAELTKLGLILYTSALLNKNLKLKKDPYRVFGIFMIPVILSSVLIILQPNMSTAFLIFSIALIIYFGSGAPVKPFLLSLPVVAVILFSFAMISPYRRQRFMTLFRVESSQEVRFSTDYHTRQILISLGSGGLWGLGVGQSRQKYDYLPEVASDSIFAVLGEELGFVGTTLLVGIFTYLIFLGYHIAARAPDMFSRCLALGVTSWIGLQFFINVAAMVRVIPLTGIPIPLISYGGSSLFFVLCGLGILAGISKYTE